MCTCHVFFPDIFPVKRLFGYENKTIEYKQQTIWDEKQNAHNLFHGNYGDNLGENLIIHHINVVFGAI